MSCSIGNPVVEIPEGTDAVVRFILTGNDGQIITTLSPLVQSAVYKVSTDSSGAVEIFSKVLPSQMTIETGEVKVHHRCKITELLQVPIFDTDITGIAPGTYYHECQVTDVDGFTTTVFEGNTFTITESSIS